MLEKYILHSSSSKNMEMLEENNKMACWNVYGFCYVKLIIFLNKKALFHNV